MGTTYRSWEVPSIHSMNHFDDQGRYQVLQTRKSDALFALCLKAFQQLQ